MIGKLDRRVKLQNYSTSANAYGELEKTYSDLAEVWAMFRFKTGNEKTEGEQVTAIEKHEFVIRYRSDFNEKGRIFYDSKYYYVKSLGEYGEQRKRYLKIIAENRD